MLTAIAIYAFAISGFAGEMDFTGSCSLTPDQRDRKDSAQRLTVRDKSALFKAQWAREAAGLRTQGQRDTLAYWTSIIDEVYAADTAAKGFYDTELGKKVKRGVLYEKLNFTGKEVLNIFEIPQPDLLTKYTQTALFTQAKLMPSGGMSPPPNCTCAAIISACAWTDGCYTPVSCTQVVGCGPGEAFMCTIVCSRVGAIEEPPCCY
jgi:hypothetical protein